MKASVRTSITPFVYDTKQLFGLQRGVQDYHIVEMKVAPGPYLSSDLTERLDQVGFVTINLIHNNNGTFIKMMEHLTILFIRS